MSQPTSEMREPEDLAIRMMKLEALRPISDEIWELIVKAKYAKEGYSLNLILSHACTLIAEWHNEAITTARNEGKREVLAEVSKSLALWAMDNSNTGLANSYIEIKAGTFIDDMKELLEGLQL